MVVVVYKLISLCLVLSANGSELLHNSVLNATGTKLLHNCRDDVLSANGTELLHNGVLISTNELQTLFS